VIKRADWVIDMGPDAGPSGGRVVVQGPPELVAAEPQSHTGRYLREVLDQKDESLHSSPLTLHLA
jgi:excinuclease ABC subunit A